MVPGGRVPRQGGGPRAGEDAADQWPVDVDAELGEGSQGIDEVLSAREQYDARR